MIFKKLKQKRERKIQEKSYSARFDSVLISNKVTHQNIGGKIGYIMREINPKELDIYIPDLKLAIEYNGTYWHAEERQNNIYIHREKSISCHNLNIRLIHIFEFENF